MILLNDLLLSCIRNSKEKTSMLLQTSLVKKFYSKMAGSVFKIVIDLILTIYFSVCDIRTRRRFVTIIYNGLSRLTLMCLISVWSLSDRLNWSRHEYINIDDIILCQNQLHSKKIIRKNMPIYIFFYLSGDIHKNRVKILMNDFILCGRQYNACSCQSWRPFHWESFFLTNPRILSGLC